MKIAYVYDAVYPWETGGVQKRVWELARRLASDHDVHWFGRHYWDGPRRTARDGVTLHGVAQARNLYAGDRRAIGEAVSFTARLVAPLLRESFDVIDCQEFPYLPAFPTKLHALVRDSAFVFTWHELWGDYWYEYLGRAGVAGEAVERAVARLPDRHVAVSERTRREVRALGPDRVDLVPNGISLAETADAAAAERDVDVLFVGRLIPQKGVDTLVRAVGRLREEGTDRRLTVVGEGPRREALGRLAADRAPGAVKFLDVRETHAEVLGLMKAARVFVLPSRREGFGMTVLEALACGTPVVTVDHPRNAAADLVSDGVGIVCAPDADALADAIDRAPATGPAPRTVARDYDWDRIADRQLAVYGELA